MPQLPDEITSKLVAFFFFFYTKYENCKMDHTDAVYQFVTPRIKFPPKPFPFGRAFAALHGRHSVSFPPLSFSLSLSLSLSPPLCGWQEAGCGRSTAAAAQLCLSQPAARGTREAPDELGHFCPQLGLTETHTLSVFVGSYPLNFTQQAKNIKTCSSLNSNTNNMD